MQIAARWIFAEGAFRPWGILQWEGAYFTQVTWGICYADVDYQPWLIVPGLVNLHTHLELTDLEGLLPQGVGFPIWVNALRRETQAWNAPQYAASFLKGLQAVQASGCMTVVDIGNSNANWDCDISAGVRILALREMMGLNPQVAIPRLENAKRDLQMRSPEAQRIMALSAHAPYSCSPALLRDIANHCQQLNVPFFMHAAESQGEQELYSTAQGAFRNWIDTFYTDHVFQNPCHSVLSFFHQHQIPLDRAVWVHANTLTPIELQHAHQHNIPLVHCPQSHAWFGNPEFKGFPAAVATDSLASAKSLDLWEQLNTLQQKHPEFDMETMLSMVTEIPAQALQNLWLCGQLATGKLADWFAVALPESPEESWNWLLQKSKRKIVNLHFANEDI